MPTACLPVTGVLTLSVSTPPEPRSHDPRRDAPRPAERTSILRRTDGLPEEPASPDPADSMPTQALPTDWADGQPTTSVMPTGAGGWSDGQPATSVMPTGADEWADSRPTTVAPAYAPAPSVQTPGAPAQWNEPAAEPAPAAGLVGAPGAAGNVLMTLHRSWR